MPRKRRICLRSCREGPLPREVESGELLDEFPVLVPALGDVTAVKAVVVREPGDPDLETLEIEPLVVRRVGGPADRDGGTEGLWELGGREEPVIDRTGAGGSSGHRDRLVSTSTLRIGAKTTAERGRLGRTVGPLVKSS